VRTGRGRKPHLYQHRAGRREGGGHGRRRVELQRFNSVGEGFRLAQVWRAIARVSTRPKKITCINGKVVSKERQPVPLRGQV